MPEFNPDKLKELELDDCDFLVRQIEKMKKSLTQKNRKIANLRRNLRETQRALQAEKYLTQILQRHFKDSSHRL